MTLLIATLLGLVAAFISSLPMGPVNLAVVQASINNGRTAAVRIALGSAVAELFYCLLGVLGAELVTQNHNVVLALEIVSIPVLVLLGCYNLIKRMPAEEPERCETTQARKRRGAFWLGISLNLLNPTLLPWWMMVSTQLHQRKLLETTLNDLVGFALGVAGGTFLLLLVVGLYGAKHREIIRWETRVRINRAIGVLFLVFAVLITYKVWSDLSGGQALTALHLG